MKCFRIVMTLYLLALPVHAAVKKPQILKQGWGVNMALLVQNASFREFSHYDAVKNTWYAQGYNAWMAGIFGMGFSVGAAYDILFKDRGLFRVHFQLESTGWIGLVLDIGGGVRIPINKHKLSFSGEFYFSTVQSGGYLANVSDF